jgi:GH24 family phage-related lysozyme (muramidase)
MFLRWLVVLLMGGTMAVPDIDWNQLEQIAETDSELRSALDVVTARMPEPASTPEPASSLATESDQQAKALLLAHEGDKFDSRTQRHYVYEDSEGKPTIGYGHLVRDGENFSGGITDEQALALFDKDFQIHKEILFAELALNEGSMFANSSYSEAGNNWQYAFLHPIVGQNINYIDGGELSVTADDNGNTTISGFANREELLAAGQARYEQMPANVQAAVLSVTYNYGSTGPQTIREVNKAIDSGDYVSLANHYKTTLANENQGKLRNRRNDEANLISIGKSVQVRQSAEMKGSTLNRLNVPDVFGGSYGLVAQDMSTFEQAGKTTPVQRGAQKSSSSGPFLGVPLSADTLGDAIGLSEQYGAFGFFMYDRNERGDLFIGVDINGNPVAYNDPSALTQVDVVSYIETMTNIDPTTDIAKTTQIPSLLRKTQWGMENNSRMREFDVEYQKKSEADRLEFLQATIDEVSDGFRAIGYDLTDQEIYDVAYNFQRLHGPVTQANTDTLYKTIFAAVENKEMVNELNEFEGMVENTLVDAGNYYLTMDEDEARGYAEQLLTGDLSQAELTQILQAKAAIAYPHLAEQATELGVTPKTLLGNTEVRIENLLGKKVDLRDSQWNPVINYVDDSGRPRLMTTWEAENYVRSTEDYLGSNKGQEKIYSLVDALADSFGRV